MTLKVGRPSPAPQMWLHAHAYDALFPFWLAQGQNCRPAVKHVIAWLGGALRLFLRANACDVGNGVELGEHYDEIARSLLGK